MPEDRMSRVRHVVQFRVGYLIRIQAQVPDACNAELQGS